MATTKTYKELTTKYFTQSGVVIGKMYGGGKGQYNARNFKADSIEELKEKLQKAFELGSLDSGFGFEKLLAAGVQIVTERHVDIDGLDFSNRTYENYVIGDVDLFEEAVEMEDIVDNLPESEVVDED